MNRVNTLTEREYRSLLRAALAVTSHRTVIQQRPMIWWAVLIGGNLGVRVGELVSLRVRDLELNTRPPALHVRTLKQRRAVTDTIPLGRTMSTRLRQLAGTRDAESPLLYKRTWNGRSRPYTKRAVQAAFERLVARAGLKRPRGWRLSFHALRHFRGSQLYAATRDPVLVSRMLRHRRVASADRYMHLDGARLEAVIEATEID